MTLEAPEAAGEEVHGEDEDGDDLAQAEEDGIHVQPVVHEAGREGWGWLESKRRGNDAGGKQEGGRGELVKERVGGDSGERDSEEHQGSGGRGGGVGIGWGSEWGGMDSGGLGKAKDGTRGQGRASWRGT